MGRPSGPLTPHTAVAWEGLGAAKQLWFCLVPTHSRVGAPAPLPALVYCLTSYSMAPAACLLLGSLSPKLWLGGVLPPSAPKQLLPSVRVLPRTPLLGMQQVRWAPRLLLHPAAMWLRSLMFILLLPSPLCLLPCLALWALLTAWLLRWPPLLLLWGALVSPVCPLLMRGLTSLLMMPW